jgi:4-amino-4-deoxy-L-arabinose transferase-like glycosyltransferase
MRSQLPVSDPIPHRSIRSASDLARFVDRHETACRILVVFVFVWFNLQKACTTPLWFDEFMTLFISRLSQFGEIWRAIPADGQPPLQYVITHVLLRVFGQSAFVLRSPELIAYMAAGVLAYRVVRRYTGPVPAMFAMVMVLDGGMVGRQAYTGRPYGLLLMFTALTFSCWQQAAGRESKRVAALVGVAVGVAGAVLSHHFGIVNVLFFLSVGETSRFTQRKRVDGSMFAAIVLGALPMLVNVPLAHASRAIFGDYLLRSANFPFKPTFGGLLIYLQLVPLFLLALFGLFCLMDTRAGRRESAEMAGGVETSRVPKYEWAACVALCLLLPVLLLIAKFMTGGFADRYAIGASLGIAILCGWGLPNLLLPPQRGLVALSRALLVFVCLKSAISLRATIADPFWKANPSKIAISPVLDRAPANQTIVVASAYDYVSEWWYSSPSVRKKLLFVFDTGYAVTQQDFPAELSIVADRLFVPMPMEDYRTFLKQNDRFFLLCSGEPRFYWLDRRLKESGWKLDALERSGGDVLYLAEGTNTSGLIERSEK